MTELALLVGALLSQCATGITDNAQNLCGAKTFPNGAVVGQNAGDYEGLAVKGAGIYIDGPYAEYSGSGTLLFRDRGAAGNLGYVFDTWNAKTGELLRIYNHGVLKLMIDAAGNVYSYGSFIDQSGTSSHVSLGTTAGYNVVVQGRGSEQQLRYRSECFNGQPNPDGGSICHWPFAALHGAGVDLAVSTSMAAGFPVCVHNPGKPVGTPQYPTAPGAESWCVDYLGGMTPIGPLDLAEFGTVTWEAAMQPNSTWTYGQYKGTLMFADDQDHWYVQGAPDANYTAENRPDAGNWRQLAYTHEWLARVQALEARLADAGL